MRLSSFFIFIFLTFNLIGQTDPYPKVIVHNSDTVLAFTLAQARKLSVFNEERNIKKVIASVKKIVNRIIVIDNNSSDNTMRLIKKLSPLDDF